MVMSAIENPQQQQNALKTSEVQDDRRARALQEYRRLVKEAREKEVKLRECRYFAEES